MPKVFGQQGKAMSHSRSYGREMMAHSSSGNALQKEREREKKRREQQLIKQQETREEPVFSQPRKVTTTRQDSLTRNINNVLGDPNLVSGILFREPNIWLGTSRSSQGPPTPAPTQPQDEPPLYPTSGQRKPSPSQKNYANSQKRGSSGSYSSSSYSQSSKQTPPPVPSSSNQTQHSSSSIGSHGYNKSRNDPSSRSGSSISHTKQSHETFSRNRHGQSHPSSAYSGNSRSSKQDQSHKTAAPQATFNSSHLPIMQKDSLLPLDSHEPDKSSTGLKVELPARISERDRVSSVDSDMLGGVENILKEMVEPMELLTEIKTPSVSENKFNFLGSKRKLDGPESSLESSNTDAIDGVASDSDSSEDESSDEEDEDNNKKVNWNLSSWTAQPQPVSNPLLSNERVPENGSKGSTTSSTFAVREDQTSRVSTLQDHSRHTPSSPVKSNQNQSNLRGRKADKRQPPSSSKSSTRQRSSSSSSQRSASSGHRSASSGRRSTSSHHRSTSNQSRKNVPNMNQSDPWSSGKKQDFQSHSTKPDHGKKRRPGPDRRISDIGASRSPGKSNSNRLSPHGSYRESPSYPHHSPHVSNSKPQSLSPQGSRSSPDVHAKKNVPNKDLKPSGVSKETLSRTAQDSERHKVGRKGPSPRVHKGASYDSSSTTLTAKPPIKPSSTGLSDCSSSSDSEMSDDESNVDVKNLPLPVVNTPAESHQQMVNSDSDSASESSSESDSDSSSSSDSESENEGANRNAISSDVPQFKTPVSNPSQVSWKLGDLAAKSEPKMSNTNFIPKMSPRSHETAKEHAAKMSRTSPYHVPNNRNNSSPRLDPNSRTSPPVQPPKPSPQRPQTNPKKASRKSAPGALTPNPWSTSNRDPTAKPQREKRAYEKNINIKSSPRSHNTSWSDAGLSAKDKNNPTTVDTVNSQRSSSFAKKGRTPSVGDNSRRRSSPQDGRCTQPSEFTNAVSEVIRSPQETDHLPPRDDIKNVFPPLWVRIKATLLGRDLTQSPVSVSPGLPTHKSPQNASTKRSGYPSTTVSPPKSSKLPDKSYAQPRCPTTVSTGSETEQPIRRADNVQVAVADGSTDWEAHGTSSASKRKLNSSEPQYDDSHPQSMSNSNKRRKRDIAGSRQSSPGSNTSSPWLPERSQRKNNSPSDHWREPVGVGRSSEQVSNNHQQNRHVNHQLNPDGYHSNRTPNSRTQPRQESPTSNNPSCQPVLPDSSVPEQERIRTSYWYMSKGQDLKHETDNKRLARSRIGRTRPGEALSYALAYFESSLFFIMSGHVMEAENIAERAETGSNSGSSSTYHSLTRMYQRTIELLDFVLRMRPHIEQEDQVFKRIMISCFRCQAVLYYRIFKRKKELLNEQFKNMSKSNRTPSQLDHNPNAAPNVLSPMSPAVPSPVGHHPGPSPVSNNGEQVSSSTQAGKMTPPSHQGLLFPQKTYDMYRQQYSVMHLLQAHDKWDQGESMLEGQTNFFQNIDTLCSRTLNFHTSLRDVFFYHKMVLHQLRTLTTISPRE